MRLPITLLAALLAAPLRAEPLLPLQGDPEAVARIEKMYSQIGGRGIWADAKSMTIRYRQLSSGTRPGEGVEYAWRDMTRPRERLEWVRTDALGTRTNFGRGNDESRGWRRRPDGSIVESRPEELKADLKFWERDYYTMFKRMAAGDPSIRYRFIPPNRIEATDSGGQLLNWWDIDSAGWLLQWGTTDSDGSPINWYYGPYKKYGRIAFPAWGISPQFLIRFEYVDFRISPKPFPEQVLADPINPPSPKLLAR